MKKLKIILIILLVITLIPIGINTYVILSTKNKIYENNEITEKYDYALVLGCAALKNGEPSKMLKDRLNKAIEIYENNLVNNIIISGDHSASYSEVTTMENYLLKEGIPKDAIIRDDIGYSTGESLVNYKNNFQDKKVIIITQEYHLYRALYIAKTLNLNAIGSYAKKVNYNGQFLREIREILARNKDFLLYTF